MPPLRAGATPQNASEVDQGASGGSEGNALDGADVVGVQFAHAMDVDSVGVGRVRRTQ